jgi:hypothetical protein
MKDSKNNKAHFHSKRMRAQTPPRVAARMEGKVKNAATKPKLKPKQKGKKD